MIGKVKTTMLLIGISLVLTACGQTQRSEKQTINQDIRYEDIQNEIIELDNGLSYVQYNGDYGFELFLEQGGASKDQDIITFLTTQVFKVAMDIQFGNLPFGCSTLSVANQDGGYLFGRNFDWTSCNAMIVSSKPEAGYASVSTVNLDFIQSNELQLSSLSPEMQATLALYAPLDGMNEKGFAVSVNMIEDSASINQETEKPDITTTTAIRLLLNYASNVEEAVQLLGEYDLHSSMNMMVHFAMADESGRSVVVEYINQEMVVTETPIVTNFYMAEGSKYGIGSFQSHQRYQILKELLEEHNTMNEDMLRDAMDRVSKDNFNEFESTEWTIIMNQKKRELTYFHRENYEVGYTIGVEVE